MGWGGARLANRKKKRNADNNDDDDGGRHMFSVANTLGNKNNGNLNARVYTFYVCVARAAIDRVYNWFLSLTRIWRDFAALPT